jgi:pyruvate dehydrogenase E1 component alpha subunit
MAATDAFRRLDADAAPDGLSEGDLLELYRRMVLLRTYDERSVVYHRQGRIGTYAIFWNHEAIQAGATFALADSDWIFPSYRESAIGLVRGMPAATILQWWRGHPSGWWNPADWNVASICVPIATHVPHATGLAWGKKLRGEDTVAMAFFGDGATSEGVFHEGVNFAAVMDAPVVFVCNNNGWAISTPVEEQTRAATLADKAAGYGIPGVRVDGLDVLAVYEAAREAVERARAGGGPTLIEGGAARDGRRPPRVHRPQACRRGTRARVPRTVRALPQAPRAARRGADHLDPSRRRGVAANRHHRRRGRACSGSRADVQPRLCRPAGEHAQWLS